ncbi:hypothetical protein ES703_79212 [subsurface metagenome]
MNYETRPMNVQTRNLYRQIMAAVVSSEGISHPTDEPLVMQVTGITPGKKDMDAVQGTPIEKGPIDVTLRPGVYLTRTVHRRGEKDVPIYNVCVMDAAGDIRLLQDMRVDGRGKDAIKQLWTSLAELVDEHDQLNNPEPPTYHQLMHALDKATTMIKALPSDEWMEWTTYFLEAMDGKPNKPTYELFMENLQYAIEARLTTGMW